MSTSTVNNNIKESKNPNTNVNTNTNKTNINEETNCFACRRPTPLSNGWPSLWGPMTMSYCQECLQYKAENEDIIRIALGLEDTDLLPNDYPNQHAVRLVNNQVKYIPLWK
jgi:hypothetical protein